MQHCRPGWTEYNGRCFQFNTDQVTWEEAERVCRDQSSTLATINNEYEQQFLAVQLAECEYIYFKCTIQNILFTIHKEEQKSKMLLIKIFTDRTHMWIGFHCMANKYLFEWLSGHSVQYTNWARREPNGARENEDCVMVYWDVSDIYLNA